MRYCLLFNASTRTLHVPQRALYSKVHRRLYTVRYRRLYSALVTTLQCGFYCIEHRLFLYTKYTFRRWLHNTVCMSWLDHCVCTMAMVVSVFIG